MLALMALSAPAAVLAEERRLTVTDFDRVQVDGPFEVTLATGRPNAATVNGTSQAIDRVSVDVQGRTLRIRPNRSAWGGYPKEGGGPVKIVLATHDLRSAAVNGSGSINIDKARAMRFDVSVSGSGSVAFHTIEADSLIVGLLGSGRISAAGKVKTLRATIQGSGDFDAGALTVEDAEINADTSGEIGVAVRRAAKVTATGAGNVEIKGSPACTVKAHGSGRVLCGAD